MGALRYDFDDLCVLVRGYAPGLVKGPYERHTRCGAYPGEEDTKLHASVSEIEMMLSSFRPER